MGRNSNKDPALIAARERTLELLREAADVAEVALDAFIQDPRWCGLPGQDRLHDHRYPQNGLSSWLDPSATSSDSCYIDVLRPKDEASGADYHVFQITAMVRAFRAGLPTFKRDWNKPRKDWKLVSESPITFMDRIRGVLRYAHRTDDDTMLTASFALLECVRVGRPVPDVERKYNDKTHQYDETLLGTTSQEYEYRPLSEERIAPLQTVLDTQAAIRAVYDHVGLALLPKDPSKADLMFIEWINGRGGKARGMEVRKWLGSVGLPDGGQDPAFTYFKKWCDKSGKARSQKPWELRPEALTLIGVKP